ncbi:CU044_5270 family protein [Actinoallomurus rhizosphaericola]|uniref:CU044_5270 family protein n=1 Tax=Actinoallomurus rhizosphaericola TaxID=2952536 RepID=UPI0020903DDB|nr:CU044_5270 family protein [Actinoallomurus rhizosphaericola]MCO5993609.1 CU044_5270 family protein [Actinoallomurus rhizosphaericola]
MDDIQAVSRLLEEGDPSAAVTATGRRRLDELIRQEPARAPRDVPAGRRRQGRRRLRWALPGLGLVAAGTAAAIALTGTSAPSHGPRPAPAQTEQRLSGREVLLAAAASAEKTPPTAGRYWHVRRIRTIAVSGGRPVGNVLETWAAKDGWWYMGSADLENHGDALDKKKYKDGRSFELEDHMLSFDRLRGLPADPRRLTTWARAFSRGLNPQWRPKDVEDATTDTLSTLLYAVPVSPSVRAAAFRALARRPGVTAGGRVADSQGRVGQAVRLGPSTLIIDTKSSFVLQETVETVDHVKRASTVYLEVGWTDEKPHVPTAS